MNAVAEHKRANRTRLSIDPGDISTPTARQDCPRCEGVLPAESISIGPWIAGFVDGGPVLARKIYMHCPHCEYRAARTERKELN